MDEKEQQIDQLLNESFVRPYLEDDGITDISYNGVDLWIQHNTKGRIKANVQPKEEEVEFFIRRIADIQGKGFTDSEPILDTQLDFLRVNAVHKAVSPSGITMALRVSRPKKVMESLAEVSDEEVEQLLHVLIQAETSMVISGKTGAGKTEIQKMLIGYTQDDKSITLIEDTMDSHIKALYPQKDIKSWRILINDDRERKITFPILIKSGLRNNPDWLLVSEARAAEEAFEIVQGVISGHAMVTTVHTSAASSIPNRILNMVRQVYKVNELVYGLDLVTHIPIGIHTVQDENENGEIIRYIREIVEFTDFNEKGVICNPIYQVKHVYVGEGKYEKKIEKSPLSEKTKKRLQDKRMYHLLPDVFKS